MTNIEVASLIIRHIQGVPVTPYHTPEMHDRAIELVRKQCRVRRFSSISSFKAWLGLAIRTVELEKNLRSLIAIWLIATAVGRIRKID